MRERAAMWGFSILFGGAVLGSILLGGMEPGTKPVMASGDTAQLAVLMYHQVTGDPARIGDYVVTAQQFSSDLTALQLAGYTAVSVDDVLAFAEGESDLPPKPVLITFDDGYETFIAEIYPILCETKTPCVLSLVGKYTDFYSCAEDQSLSYACLNWDEVEELAASPYVEIANHSYALHQMAEGERRGALPLEGEAEDEYRAFLENDLTSCNRCIQEQTGKEVRVFAYPYGLYTDVTCDVVENLGFSMLLTCEERVNTLHRREELKPLGRFNRSGNLSTEEVLQKIEPEK